MKLCWGEYIYLHFMDRELRGSLGMVGRILDITAKQWVKTALLMSDMPLYVSLSHMYESFEEFPKTVQFLFELEKLHLVMMVTSHTNEDEFLESRRNLYSFDKDRYGNYFKGGNLVWPVSIYKDNKGTTAYLRKQMLVDDSITKNKRIDEEIHESLERNKNDAITINRFVPLVQNIALDNFQKITTQIKLSISSHYTRKYLDVFNGTIVNGLDGFGEYDDLAKRPFYTDLKIYAILCKPVLYKYETNDDGFIGYLFSDECNWLKTICHNICEMTSELIKHGEPMDAVLVLIKKHMYLKNANSDISALFSIYNDLKVLCKERGIDTKMETNVFLIVIATQLEYEILYDCLSRDYKINHSVGKMSYLTTSINENIIYIIKNQMGTNGPGGATLTVEDAVKDFNPDAVLMCGIAWGGDPTKQRIGDVLVATKVWEYDPVKKNDSGEVFRGNITPASPKIIQALELVSVVKREIPTHFGLVASGSFLLNSELEVDRLKKQNPELIGGEMEAAGVSSVCEREKKDWAMIKGICDWGFEKDSDNKEEYQRIAANNAFKILIDFLQKYSNA